MALARVVSFDGVSADRIAEMRRDMQDDQQPEGLNATLDRSWSLGEWCETTKIS